MKVLIIGGGIGGFTTASKRGTGLKPSAKQTKPFGLKEQVYLGGA